MITKFKYLGEVRLFSITNGPISKPMNSNSTSLKEFTIVYKASVSGRVRTRKVKAKTEGDALVKFNQSFKRISSRNSDRPLNARAFDNNDPSLIESYKQKLK